MQEHAGADEGHAGKREIHVKLDEPHQAASHRPGSADVEQHQGEDESEEQAVRDPPVHQENRGRVDAAHPGDESIQVRSYAAQHQSCQELFFQLEIASEKVGQYGVEEKVHYIRFCCIPGICPLRD